MEEVLKCPLCEKTYSNNKGGGLTTHLKKVHSIETVEEMMKRFPEIAHHFNCKIREKTENFDKIQCKICGQWMTAVTHKHLKSHNMSSEEYKEKYGRYSQYSQISLDKIRNRKKPQRKIKVTISICLQCGKEFEHKPSRDSKFCSVQCKVDSQKGKQPYKIDLDVDRIKKLYLEDKVPLHKIAEDLQVSRKTIYRRLKDENSDIRTRGESRSLYLQNNPEQNPYKLPHVRAIISQRNRDYFSIEENRDRVADKVREAWKDPEYKKNISDKAIVIMAARTPQEVYDQLMKQYATKRERGTWTCSGLEDKYEELYLKDIEHIPQYIIPEGIERYAYDFYIPSTHTLIEVNGTGPHADPRYYKADDVIRIGIPGWEPKTAQEIWDKDKRKKEYAESLGYKIETVWEKDF